jgi:hypothetical protein
LAVACISFSIPNTEGSSKTPRIYVTVAFTVTSVPYCVRRAWKTLTIN